MKRMHVTIIIKIDINRISNTVIHIRLSGSGNTIYLDHCILWYRSEVINGDVVMNIYLNLGLESICGTMV